MIPRLSLVLLPLLVAACDGRPLPVAPGPLRQLNVGPWTPGPNDLTVPPDPARPAARAAAVTSSSAATVPPVGGGA